MKGASFPAKNRASCDPILHVNGDEFFASLARMRTPRVGNRPVVVGYLCSRGRVVGASYEARRAGVEPGQSMVHARRLCPKAVQVPVDWNQVRRASRAFRSILETYSPLVEVTGPDAAYLDYRGCRALFGAPEDFAGRLQRKVCEELKWTLSVGVSMDKATSIVACRAAKAGGIEVVAAGGEFDFMRSYPVSWLPGIRPASAAALMEMGVRTIGELASIPVLIMEHIWGEDGRRLVMRARGEEGARIRRRGSAVLEVSRYFRVDILDGEVLEARLAELSGTLCRKLRAVHRSARSLTFRLTYSDGVSVHRLIVLSPSSHRDPEIFRAVRSVLPVLYRRRVRVRRMSLEVHRLEHISSELPLMDDARYRLKWDRVLAAVDAFRRRSGAAGEIIRLGAALVGKPSAR